MKNNIVTYLFTAIIAVMFSACGADTTSTSYNPDSSTPTEDSSYSPNENPIASTVTSFAQDLALYDIASLDESSRAIRKADTAQDNGSDDESNDDSSNDDSSNDDGSNDKSNDDSSNDDESNDDSSNDTNSNDDSDDESSED
ncbi:MAG: hypothetical protein U9P38_07455, partial [Campylobacterota bacterium]|nr:hypothetical protein [Campylobacterota bacterium]